MEDSQQPDTFCTKLHELLSEETLRQLKFKIENKDIFKQFAWMDEPIAKLSKWDELKQAAKIPSYAWYRCTYPDLFKDHFKMFGIKNLIYDIDPKNFVRFGGNTYTTKDVLEIIYHRLYAYLGEMIPDLHQLSIVESNMDELMIDKWIFQEFDKHHSYNTICTTTVEIPNRKLSPKEWLWIKDQKAASARKRTFFGVYPSNRYLNEDGKLYITFGAERLEII